MQLHKWTTIWGVAILVVSGVFSNMVRAQPSRDVRVEIDAIKNSIVELKQASVGHATLANAVAQFSSQLIILEQEVATSRRSTQSQVLALEELDKLRDTVERLRTEVEYLRTGIATIEQYGSRSPNAKRRGRVPLSSIDGRYTAAFGGYVQARYQIQSSDNLSGNDVATFWLPRGRLSATGEFGDKNLGYSMLAELTRRDAPLLEYVIDWHYKPEFTIRVGQAKVPYSRAFLLEASDRIFHGLTLAQNRLRYDRDVGIWAMGSVWDRNIHYHLGVSNGSGQNRTNTNFDVAMALRMEVSVLGSGVASMVKERRQTGEPTITVGAAIVHDFVEIPGEVSGIEVRNRDVDRDGANDNIQVLSSVVDAHLQGYGFEAQLEATWRHERWGAIVGHRENRELADAVSASISGRRNYLNFTAELSYFVLPKVLVGTRASHGRLPVLGLGGRSYSSAPRAQRALQIDGIVQVFSDGARSIGVSYGVTNFNEKDGPDPNNDIQHSFIIETQLIL